MRQGFTLIELMIVIAIIAVIAAIAIPNLLESRVSSQEAAAAASLKSGVLPSQVQFQGGSYSDLDADGVGTYAVVDIAASGSTTGGYDYPYNVMSGGAMTTGGLTLTLLAPTYRGTGTVTISAYNFAQPVAGTAPGSSATSDGDAEQVWGASASPTDINNGRRGFAINQAGNVYSSKPSVNLASHTADVGPSTVFGASLTGSPGTSLFIPYRR